MERAQTIRVKLADGREFDAETVGRDPSTDVALMRLRLDAPIRLPVTYLGNSDALEVGDWVVAIGNPFGLDHSVSHGMISAKERVIGVGMFDDFIQTDALINPGNSGGPLFNMSGEVVGVNSAIVSQGQGIGFAVPINMVKDLLPNLRNNGRLARGWMGINVQTAASETSGAIITDVFRDSPAAAAGLKPGDRVLAVNGRAVETYLQLLRRIAILAPGTRVRISVRRGERELELPVLLSERRSPESLALLFSEGKFERLGLVLRDSSDAAAVVVVGVLPTGSAQQAGVKEGDVVIEVNRRPVATVRAFRAALEQVAAGRSSCSRSTRRERAEPALRPSG